MKLSPLKATDFGLSIPHRPGDPKLRGRSGTPAYMAPEVILQVGCVLLSAVLYFRVLFCLGWVVYQISNGSMVHVGA